MQKKEIVGRRDIESRIFLIRGRRGMLDADLAGLYGVRTKYINQQVSRNIERFPDTFMFRLKACEKDELVAKLLTHPIVAARFSTDSHKSSCVANEYVVMLLGLDKSGLIAYNIYANKNSANCIVGKEISMKQAHGNWVTGDTFWGRDAEIRAFIQKIDEGANIILLAPRRMGKTSLMHEALKRLSERYLCVFVDLQKSESSADALVELGRAIYPFKNLRQKWATTASGMMKSCLSAVEEFGVYEFGFKLRGSLTEGNWDTEADKLLDILAASDRPAVIFMDEVPIMVNRLLRGDDFRITSERRQKVDKFMSWLRSNTLRLKGKVMFVVSGSIGFSPVLNQVGLSATLNTFTPFSLKPWEKTTAEGCLKSLAEEYKIVLTPQVTAEMTRLLGCLIPHHVQMYFSQLEEYCKRKNIAEPGIKDVGIVYKEDMLGPRGYNELVHYEERLKLVLGEELLPATLAILAAAASKRVLTYVAIPQLLKEYGLTDPAVEEARKKIIQVLEHDGYLEEKGAGYVFVSRLVRDWWKKRHCCR